MPYCINCGQSYSRPANYCSKCGLSLSAAASSFASDSDDAHTRSLGSERSYWHLRRKRIAAAESNDSLRVFAGCVAGVAFIHGLSIMAGASAAKLLEGWPLALLLAGILFGGGLKLLWDLRYGYSPARSLIEMAIVGVLCYGIIVGMFWYFDSMLKSGQPLFKLTPLPSRTPHAFIILQHVVLG